MKTITQPTKILSFKAFEEQGSYRIEERDVVLPVIRLTLVECMLYPEGTSNVSSGKIVVNETNPTMIFPQACPAYVKSTQQYEEFQLKVRIDALEWLRCEMPEMYKTYADSIDIGMRFNSENKYSVKEYI